MRNNLKKVGIIGACLVAMIGTGGCLTTMAVVGHVKSKMAEADYEKHQKADKQAWFDKYKNRFNYLTNQINQNLATSDEVLEYSRLLRMEKLHSAGIIKADTGTNPQYYLNQANQMGSINAKAEILHQQVIDTLASTYSGEVKNHGEFDKLIEQSFIKVAKNNPETFCQIYPIEVPNTSLNSYWAEPVKFSAILEKPTDTMTQSNIKNIQLLDIIDHMLNCHDYYRYKDFREDFYKLDFITDVIRFNEKYEPQNKDRVAYGAYAILSEHPLLMERLLDSTPTELVNQFKQDSQKLADEYKRMGLPIRKAKYYQN